MVLPCYATFAPLSLIEKYRQRLIIFLEIKAPIKTQVNVYPSFMYSGKSVLYMLKNVTSLQDQMTCALLKKKKKKPLGIN